MIGKARVEDGLHVSVIYAKWFAKAIALFEVCAKRTWSVRKERMSKPCFERW
jgi:hypothetical protein